MARSEGCIPLAHVLSNIAFKASSQTNFTSPNEEDPLERSDDLIIRDWLDHSCLHLDCLKR